ncbi:SPASM domain-containing protein, partial [archaeon]|nr:SPASM domain-containing protein [archaeon]
LSFGIFKKKVCNFSLSLTPEGFISACHQVTLNNKKNEPFLVGEYKNIIKIDKNKLQKLQNRTTENILQCKSCFLKYDCAGHCALESYHLSGDLYKIESELCKLKKKYAIKYFKSKVEKSIFGFYPFISQNLKYLIFSDYKIKLNENPYNIYLEKTLKHTKEADIILYNGKFEDLSKQKFPIISTKPIPPCISKIYKKSCFNCIELFTIDKNDNVIFCNKKKGKKFLEYLNRKALYNDYLKTVQLSSKCEYCLHKLRKKCDGRECLN